MLTHNGPSTLIAPPDSKHKILIQEILPFDEEYNFIYSVEDLSPNEKIIIYGTGNCAKHLNNLIAKFRKDIRVIAFVDSFKDSKSFCGKPLYNISNLKDNYDEQKIIIASIYYEEISLALKKHNFNNYITYLARDSDLQMFKNIIELADLKEKIEFLTTFPQNLEHTFIVYNKNEVSKTNSMFSDCVHTLIPQNNVCYVTPLTDLSYAFKGFRKEIHKSICIIDNYGYDRDNIFISAIKFAADNYNVPVKVYKHPLTLFRSYILENKKTLFISVPKNGSSTATKILKKHFTPQSLKNNTFENPHVYTDLNNPFFADYQKYVIVRNPYDRLASCYSHLKRVKCDQFMNYELEQLCKPYNFRNFCSFVANCPDEFSNQHFRSQTSLLSTPKGLISDLHLIKMESYNTDMAAFFDNLDATYEPTYANRSRPSNCNYLKDYYTPNLIKLVNKRYEEDFINFGYDFL